MPQPELDPAAAHLVDLATVMASGPGSRNVAEVTSVPRRIPLVSTASAASVDPGVRRAGQPVAAADPPVVVGAEERVEAEPLGRLRHPAQRRVVGTLLWFGENP